MRSFRLVIIFSVLVFSYSYSQEEEKLIIRGELSTDQRFLMESPNDWAWNENRLDFGLENKVIGFAKFYGNIWLRNIGLPRAARSSDLYNKGIVDPYSLEIREAYAELYGIIFKKLDLKVGKQRIAWGTGDKLNPTDNLNPYDLEDILDFGRHRGSWAINMNYYLTNVSLQGVFVPFFQPANMPVGIFGTAFSGTPDIPPQITVNEFSDSLLLPSYNIGESSTLGFKIKGFLAGFDVSLSYVWGIDGLPFSTSNIILPVDTLGTININSYLSFARNHIIGADLAGSIGSIGVWAEGAIFIAEKEIMMSTDYSALYQVPPGTLTQDSVVLKKEPYIKFVVGIDYTFFDGSYLNFQYLHGFIHERGREALNDYFMMGFEKKFFNEKLTVIPIGGGFIVSDWTDISNNYAIIYAPQLKYQANDNAEIAFGLYLFDGKGQNAFANLKDYSMISFGLKYSF